MRRIRAIFRASSDCRLALCCWALISVFAIATPVHAQYTVSVDNTTYELGDDIVVRAAIPRDVDPAAFTLYLVQTQGSRLSASPIYINPFQLQQGEAVAFPAPLPGPYELHLVDRTRGRVGMSSRFIVAERTGSRQPRQETPSPASRQSYATGLGGVSMRMVNPRDVVFGEKFDLEVRIPASMPVENQNSLSVKWYAAGAAESDDSGTQVKPGEPPSVYAPYQRPGDFELRLFDCHSDCNKAIAVLPVKVTEGKIAGALKTWKKIYAPGDPIDVTLFFRPNRYYYGNWGGPTLQLLPDPAKKLSDEQIFDWVSKCSSSCQTGLIREVMTDKIRNPLGGDGLDEEKLKAAKKPYTLDIDMKESAAKGTIAYPLYAPKEPGIYEIRFYDRGYAVDWRTYSPYYIDSVTITVERVEPAPKEVAVSSLHLVQTVLGKLQQIDSPAYFAEFHIEAMYATPNRRQVVEAPLSLSGNGQLFEIDPDGSERSLMNVGDEGSVVLMRVSDTLFRSKPLKVKPTK